MFRLIVIVLLCSSAGKTLQHGAPAVAEDEAALETVINGIRNFSDELSRTFFSSNKNKNIIISPLSIYSALSTVLPGTGSSTREELAGVLGFPKDDKLFSAAHRNLGAFLCSMEVKEIEEVYAGENSENPVTTFPEFVNNTVQELSFANGVFVDKKYSLKPSYLEVLKHYQGKTENVDFAEDSKTATDTINKWIANKTHDRIPKIYENSLDSSTAMVLASCLYFRAIWRKGLFHNAVISPLPFHTPEGVQQVQLMQKVDVIPYYDNGESYQIAQFPYEGGNFSMVIVLPYANVTLETVISSFSFSKFRETSQKFKKVPVHFKVPRLRVKLTKKIIKDLQVLNISQLFGNPDFQPMIDAAIPLYVTDVTHAVDFNMDEKGTEAAAVTVLTMFTRMRGIPFNSPVPFVVDRPYMLFIKHDKSDVPLFSGMVYNPNGQ